MAEKELPSSSEESDEDYVPQDDTADLSEEPDSDAENISCSDSDKETIGDKRKRVRKGKKKIKHRPAGEEEEAEPEDKKAKLNVDDLWADFKKDVEETSKANSANKTENSSISDDKNQDSKTVPEVSKPEPKPRLLPVMNKKAGGLGSVLGQLGKKNKVSTLEKSKLDWESFKKNEGISEELQAHNRGKDGYLERQDFLQRTDLRRFEIEKQLRATSKRH